MSWTIHDPWDRADAPNPVRITLQCGCEISYHRGRSEWRSSLIPCPTCFREAGICWEIIL